MAYRYIVYRSPVGLIYLLAGDKGLVAVGLPQKWAEFKRRYQIIAPGEWTEADLKKDKLLSQTVKALNAYFDSRLALSAGIPLDPRGTAFQRKVWAALRKIPHGKTSSYGQIAQKVGSPGAARAVGSSCGSNPLPLFIPCHRVVGQNGSLCGFGGGLALKKKLLLLEQQS